MNQYLIKKLGHQELGYVNNVPGIRGGQYFLVSKQYLDFFPPLSENIPQHLKILNIVRHGYNYPAQAKYVYDNDKFHGSTASSPRNEHRININLIINPDRKVFQKDDIIIFKKENFKNEEYEKELSYVITRYRAHKDDDDYRFLNELLSKKALNKRSVNYCLVEKNDLAEIINYRSRLFQNVLPNEMITPIVDRDIVDKNKSIQGIGSTETNQEIQIRRLVFEKYNHRCCVTNIGYKYEDFSKAKQIKEEKQYHKGIEAAHIYARAEGGPYSIDNIIPLASPVHKLFDRGIFTIDKNLKIEIHNEALKQNSLENFFPYSGQKLHIPEKISLSMEYIEWHRNKLFGAFITGDRIGSL